MSDAVGKWTPRARLPWLLALLALSAVAVVYAVLARVVVAQLVAGVVCATMAGAVLGTAVRDGRDRGVGSGRALLDGLQRLGHRLWY